MAYRRKKNGNGEEPIELKLTPMIDVVFQLLVFFLCATKFPEPEGVLKSWLPKDKGQDTTIPQVDPGSVRLLLRMEGQDLVCMYEDNNSPTGFTAFPSGVPEDSSVLFAEDRGISIPRWEEVEAHLYAAKQKYEQVGVGEQGLPVILDFTPGVPWKYVVELLNTCTKLDLTNLQIAAQELESDTG